MMGETLIIKRMELTGRLRQQEREMNKIDKLKYLKK